MFTKKVDDATKEKIEAEASQSTESKPAPSVGKLNDLSFLFTKKVENADVDSEVKSEDATKQEESPADEVEVEELKVTEKQDESPADEVEVEELKVTEKQEELPADEVEELKVTEKQPTTSNDSDVDQETKSNELVVQEVEEQDVDDEYRSTVYFDDESAIEEGSSELVDDQAEKTKSKSQQKDELKKIHDYESELTLFQITKREEKDVIFKVKVDQILLFNSCVKRVSYFRHIPCNLCNSTGAQLDEQDATVTCFKCNAKEDKVSSCVACNGFGKFICKPCTQCNGKTYCKEKIVLDIRLPITTKLEMESEYPGLGHVINNRVKGDLKITYEVVESKFFKVEGNDVVTTTLVDPIVAAVGGVIQIPSLNKICKLKIAGGLMNGDEIILKNGGLAKRYDADANKHYKQGNLVVKVQYANVTKVANKNANISQVAENTVNNPEIKHFLKPIMQELACLQTDMSSITENVETVKPDINKVPVEMIGMDQVKIVKQGQVYADYDLETADAVDKPKHKQKKLKKNKKTKNKSASKEVKQTKTKKEESKPKKEVVKAKPSKAIKAKSQKVKKAKQAKVKKAKKK